MCLCGKGETVVRLKLLLVHVWYTLVKCTCSLTFGSDVMSPFTTSSLASLENVTHSMFAASILSLHAASFVSLGQRFLLIQRTPGCHFQGLPSAVRCILLWTRGVSARMFLTSTASFTGVVCLFHFDMILYGGVTLHLTWEFHVACFNSSDSVHSHSSSCCVRSSFFRCFK